jgi:hypothetical protein
MKTLFSSALIALAAVATLPAAAQQVAPGAAGAIAHFNQDIDSRNEQVRLPSSETSIRTTTRANRAFTFALAHFNQDVDSRNDLRGLNGTTVYPGTPAYGQDIFAQIAAESAGDE